MSTYKFFADIPNLRTLFNDIPNLRTLCSNACTSKDINSGDCDLCFELHEILHGATLGVLSSHEKRYDTMEKLYGNKFSQIIKYRDIDSFNNTYWRLFHVYQRSKY
jgi:hypothetical protein